MYVYYSDLKSHPNFSSASHVRGIHITFGAFQYITTRMNDMNDNDMNEYITSCITWRTLYLKNIVNGFTNLLIIPVPNYRRLLQRLYIRNVAAIKKVGCEIKQAKFSLLFQSLHPPPLLTTCFAYIRHLCA